MNKEQLEQFRLPAGFKLEDEGLFTLKGKKVSGPIWATIFADTDNNSFWSIGVNFINFDGEERFMSFTLDTSEQTIYRKCFSQGLDVDNVSQFKKYISECKKSL